jgi:hypothetical protein
MELRDILHEVFPFGTISFCRQTSFEINGLPKASQPKNCTILAQGVAKSAHPGVRREHYLIRARGVTLYFRIGSASPGRGYDEFVTGLAAAYTSEGQEVLERNARKEIARLRR